VIWLFYHLFWPGRYLILLLEGLFCFGLDFVFVFVCAFDLVLDFDLACVFFAELRFDGVGFLVAFFTAFLAVLGGCGRSPKHFGQ
jgi:hypothetical protein